MPAELRLHATPRSSREELVVDDAGVRAYVRASPTDGAANEALVRLVARALGVPRSTVAVVRGHTSRQKVLAVSSLGPEELAHRLERFRGGG